MPSSQITIEGTYFNTIAADVLADDSAVVQDSLLALVTGLLQGRGETGKSLISGIIVCNHMTLTVLRSVLNCFSPQPLDTLGVNTCMLCMCETSAAAVRRPTPLRPAIRSEPPGLVNTRSTRAILSNTSLNRRMSSSRFSRAVETNYYVSKK